MSAEMYSLAGAGCFGLSYVFIRTGMRHSNPGAAAIVSVGVNTLVIWILTLLLHPLQALRSSATLFFVLAGICAPGCGRLLHYIGIERIGVPRSAPIVGANPLVSALLAVAFLGERITPPILLGTLSIVAGILVLSYDPDRRAWRRRDLVFPIGSALAFALSAFLRKRGLLGVGLPLVGAAVTSATGLAVLMLVQALRGLPVLRLDRGSPYFVLGGLCTTGAIVGYFKALSLGPLVVVEPLNNSGPLFGILFTMLFLRAVDMVTRRIVLGAVLVFGGVLLITYLR